MSGAERAIAVPRAYQGGEATNRAPLPLARDVLGLEGEEKLTAFWERWTAWHGAASANTLRSMQAGMKRYATWCAQLGLPVSPAAPAMLAQYVRALEADGLKPASIDNRLAAVSLLHRLAGLAVPNDDELVR